MYQCIDTFATIYADANTQMQGKTFRNEFMSKEIIRKKFAGVNSVGVYMVVVWKLNKSLTLINFFYFVSFCRYNILHILFV